MRPSESKLRLPEAAQDVFRHVEKFRKGEASAWECYPLLHRIFHKQCKVANDPDEPVTIRLPRSSGCDGVISPADPDPRDNKHNGTGYWVQVMETYSEGDSPNGAPDASDQDDGGLLRPDQI